MAEVGDDLRSVLAERARSLATASADVERDGGVLHVVARVGDTAVAIPATRTRHVVEPGALAHVPGVGPQILGLSALLGQVVPVADVAGLLGVVRAEEGAGRLVVIADGAALLGLLVDRVEEVTTLHPDDVHSMATSDGQGGLLAGTDAAAGLFVLDVDAVLSDPRLWPPTDVRPGQR